MVLRPGDSDFQVRRQPGAGLGLDDGCSGEAARLMIGSEGPGHRTLTRNAKRLSRLFLSQSVQLPPQCWHT